MQLPEKSPLFSMARKHWAKSGHRDLLLTTHLATLKKGLQNLTAVKTLHPEADIVVL